MDVLNWDFEISEVNSNKNITETKMSKILKTSLYYKISEKTRQHYHDS